MTTARSLSLVLWIAWTSWLVANYFTVPANRFDLVGGEPGPIVHGREALARAVWACAGAAFVLLAAWGLGAGAVRARGAMFANLAERGQFQLAVGCGALGYVFVVLASIGLFSATVVAVVLTLGAVAGVISTVRHRPGHADRNGRRSWRMLDRVAVVCASTAVVFAFIAALAPESEYDALWYHLWLPMQWLEAGRAVDIVEEYISLYPLNWDLLYGAAVVAGGPVAARLLHFTCLPLVGMATWLLTRRVFPQASAGLAAALAVTPPVVIWEATTAYNDLALAWFVTLGVYALSRALDTRARSWLVLAAVMFGIGAAIKHLALVYLLVAGGSVLAVAWTRTRSFRSAVRAAATLAAVALLVASPWYARAFARSGNPVFPDLYSTFGARPAWRWDDQTQEALERFKARFGRERTPATLVQLPWDMTVHGARYGGTLGPLFLGLVPFALLAGRRAQWLVLACVATLALWASPLSSFQVRFLVPLVPVLAMLGAESARRLPGSAFVIVPLMFANLPPFIAWHEADRRGDDGWLTHVLRGLPIRVVAGMESQEQYLSDTVPSYRAWRFIDRALPAGARVLTFSGGDHLYSTRERLWSEATAAAPLTWRAAAGQELLVRDRLHEAGVTHVLFDVRQLESGDVRRLAIGSEAMAACCLERLYGDSRFALYKVR
jgi:hypothetical protein